MKKILLFSLIFLILVNVINATQIWTNDEIRINDFREKVDIYRGIVEGEDVLRVNITDIIYLSIPKEMKDEEIFFVFFPTNYDFSSQTGNISEIKAIACEAGKHEVNYSLDETFGLSCPGGEFDENILNEIKINRINLLEFNASNLDWYKFLGVNNSKQIYISISYTIDNLILEAENYNTLWVKKIGCYYESSNCLDGQTAIYVSIPTSSFVEGGYNYQILKIDKESERMVFVSENPKEDIVLSYQDIKREKWNQIKWFILAVFFSFFFSLIATKFGELEGLAFGTIILLFLFLLVVLSSVVMGFSTKIAMNTYFIFLIIILGISLWNYLFERDSFRKIRNVFKNINNILKNLNKDK